MLDTPGVTHVLVALGTNDLGLPGAYEPLDELPTAPQLIAAHTELRERAGSAGIEVLVATVPPRAGSENHDEQRERVRVAVNDWIRTLGPAAVDLDAALRSARSPERLDEDLDSGDHLHPGPAGQRAIARAVVAALGPPDTAY